MGAPLGAGVRAKKLQKGWSFGVLVLKTKVLDLRTRVLDLKTRVVDLTTSVLTIKWL